MNGACTDGACTCHDGYEGDDCSTEVVSSLPTVKALSYETLLITMPGFDDANSPLSIALFGAIGLLLLTFLGGYLLNLIAGHRGVDALPFVRHIYASLSGSDYTLKPNPPPAQQ